MSDDLNRMLGQIDGKLDQVIETFKEHREDDKRRFGEVYGRLDQHAEEINKAKGGKAVLVWLVGGGAAAVATFVSWASHKLNG